MQLFAFLSLPLDILSSFFDRASPDLILLHDLILPLLLSPNLGIFHPHLLVHGVVLRLGVRHRLAVRIFRLNLNQMLLIILARLLLRHFGGVASIQGGDRIFIGQLHNHMIGVSWLLVRIDVVARRFCMVLVVFGCRLVLCWLH